LRSEYLRDEVRRILLEPGLREAGGAPLQAANDRGFFLRSADENFLLRFHGRLQFRWTHYARQSRNEYRLPRYERDDLTGFDVKRIRFHMRRHVYTKDLTYFVKWMADSPSAYDARILYAFLNYRFIDEFQFKAASSSRRHARRLPVQRQHAVRRVPHLRKRLRHREGVGTLLGPALRQALSSTTSTSSTR